eukprot:TRINITY_DN28789_c0_g1_i4.p1 TRINITY_DN28789_c0_g1~~TRINITY_DN28789_c0_g1_i4.p1  ORF type:complete len:595 (+),score=113.56 TRINITY_DN28789_c0_g1_i4:1251-3035(+)
MSWCIDSKLGVVVLPVRASMANPLNYKLAEKLHLDSDGSHTLHHHAPPDGESLSAEDAFSKKLQPPNSAQRARKKSNVGMASRTMPIPLSTSSAGGALSQEDLKKKTDRKVNRASSLNRTALDNTPDEEPLLASESTPPQASNPKLKPPTTQFKHQPRPSATIRKSTFDSLIHRKAQPPDSFIDARNSASPPLDTQAEDHKHEDSRTSAASAEESDESESTPGQGGVSSRLRKFFDRKIIDTDSLKNYKSAQSTAVDNIPSVSTLSMNVRSPLSEEMANHSPRPETASPASVLEIQDVKVSEASIEHTEDELRDDLIQSNRLREQTQEQSSPTSSLEIGTISRSMLEYGKSKLDAVSDVAKPSSNSNLNSSTSNWMRSSPRQIIDRDDKVDILIARLESLEKQNEECISLIHKQDLLIRELRRDLAVLEQKCEEKARSPEQHRDGFPPPSRSPRHTRSISASSQIPTLPEAGLLLKSSDLDDDHPKGSILPSRAFSSAGVGHGNPPNETSSFNSKNADSITHTVLEYLLSWFILGLQTLLLPLSYLYSTIELKVYSKKKPKTAKSVNARLESASVRLQAGVNRRKVGIIPDKTR